ncbi:hypothetical protein BGX38DRAFT_1180948 [Terfezia claveryi]|nr:hypothetical protein BGX38DRAFT_1180948 [Terfezia claveryi]
MPNKPKSPLGPAPALPTSVENSYRQKCLELKRRIREIEDTNEVLVLRIQRSRRGIQRARLERAFLLQQLEDRTDARVDDSEGSPSPPPTVGATTVAANAAAAAAMSDVMTHGPGSSLLLPKEKPLRVKRARKDAPDQPSSRQHSPSPPREVHPMSSYQSTFATVNPAAEILSHSTMPHTTISKKGSSRAPRGPKRPPNAYMIFCDKERNNIRRENENDEDFDMHKALAKAWRDLGHAGQKPYFTEYDRNKERYKAECEELGLTPGAAAAGPSQGKRGPRAASAGSSVAPTPAGAEAASPQEPENEEMEDVGAAGVAVNR